MECSLSAKNFLEWANSDEEHSPESKISKIKFSGWSQCAVVERGRERGRDKNNNNNNNNNNDNNNDTKIKRKDDNIIIIDNNDDKDKDNIIDNNSNTNNNHNNNNNNADTNELNKKYPTTQTIQIEVNRSINAMIKKIITEDSAERMFGRQLRKKNHQNLINNLNVEKKTKFEKCENFENDIDQKNENKSDKKMKEETEFEKIKSEKSEKFLSDWINNKYCLEKKELNLICWPYVVSGGNIEFCPYFKPNIEIQNDENSTKNSAKKSISDLHQNNQNKPNIHKICPLFHISRPITEVPIFLRIFEVEDFFPIAR